MINLEDYPYKYPQMVEEILSYFIIEPKDGKTKNKNLIEFISYYYNKYKTKDFPQPRDVARICELLCEYGPLSVQHLEGIEGIKNIYLWPGSEEWKNNSKLRQIYTNRMNCAIYGFKYIYESTYQSIVPIIHYMSNDTYGDKTIGTGFYLLGGVVTAKHCIEGAKQISIKGVSKKQLESSKFWISSNRYMDLVFIEFQDSLSTNLMTGEKPSIMEEVITMGYPKVPGFTHFQTTEKATVSAIPSKRFAAATGAVAAEPKEIWMKENLFLITAKIKGGNSGGPVINKFGEVIGVASELTFAEGNYDDMGYGTAISVEFLNKIVEKKELQLDTREIDFIDFID